MKIIVDIIHPANVHYFKNFIFEMKKQNHEVVITSRDKDVSFELLNAYGLDYIDAGTGTIGKGAIGKLLYLLFSEFFFFRKVLKHKPDIALSFASAPLAHVCWLFSIPHISFDDTEHAKLIKKLYVPFTPLVLSPNSFYDDLGDNHVKFNAYMEMFYLHQENFIADSSVLNLIGVSEGERFTIFRFVSWGAFHDIGEEGLSLEDKVDLVNEARKLGKVFISCEGEFPEELSEFKLDIPSEKLHDALFYASLYIGEGGTTASECAMIGTPSIYINSLPLMGYLQDAAKFDLLFHLVDLSQIIGKMKDVFSTGKGYYESQTNKMVDSKINPTEMLVWLVNNYPESKEALLQKNNPVS
jgi:predicted glycosyltransferase